MKRFAALYCELDQTTRTGEKVAALEAYFRDTSPFDAAWALHFLSGRSLPRAVATKNLWAWAAEEAALPPWLIQECHAAVGDTAETIALLLRNPGSHSSVSLAEVVEQRLLPLKTLPDGSRRELLLRTWRDLDQNERFVWNKMITGNFRLGVARTLVIRALAHVAGVDPSVMAHRVMGAWKPRGEDYLRIMSGAANEEEITKPYPFFLASPLEFKVAKGESLELLGQPDEWLIEWKWDGIRAQLIRRGGETLVWSRGDEMVSDAFPELIEAGHSLPEGTVLDGEILSWEVERPGPFAKLQRRLGRKKVTQRMRTDFPIAFVAYDLLETGGADIRSRPLDDRRCSLEALIVGSNERIRTSGTANASALFETPMFSGFEANTSTENPSPLRLSPIVPATSWAEVTRFQATARSLGVEGLMLKLRSSPYAVGRQRGDWWKWKIDPYVIDAVLILAQRGSGRRANLYTFGLWDNGKLVPVAKAYSGLTDAEILDVDAFVRRHSTEKFGPVRIVKPELVFELAFEGIHKSTRHKAGVAVRFPRMSRWRHDKKPEDADTLENLRAMANHENASA
ncbi:MAG: ATP-dependent DNA ligase [Chthoniobacter sp.]|nr:ATP-dependent DNA ligase [Chthoniobacter sp.]